MPVTRPGVDRLLREVAVVQRERPVVVGRERVEGIVDRGEVRHRLDARQDLLGGCAASPRGRGEVRHDRLARIQHDLPGGRVDGRRRRDPLRREAPVDLAALVRVEVEGAGRGLARRHRVGARGDGLRLERLGSPGRRHLARDDAAQVVLERDDVHDRESPGLREHAQSAPVAPVAHGVERRPGDRHRPAVARAQRDGADPPAREHGARRVEQREAGRVFAHRDGARPRDRERRRPALVGRRQARRRARRRLRQLLLEQHAHLRDAARPERRALVVVGEDLLVRPALQRVALRAVLAHAHAVAVAVAGEREGRLSRRRRGHEERNDECEHEVGAALEHVGGSSGRRGPGVRVARPRKSPCRAEPARGCPARAQRRSRGPSRRRSRLQHAARRTPRARPRRRSRVPAARSAPRC